MLTSFVDNQLPKRTPLLSLESREEILRHAKLNGSMIHLSDIRFHAKDEQMTILINFGSKDQTYQNELGQEVFLSTLLSADKAIALLTTMSFLLSKASLGLE